MLRVLVRKTPKHPLQRIYFRKFSSDDPYSSTAHTAPVDAWIKIYNQMEKKAGKISERNVASAMTPLRSEMGDIRKSVNQIEHRLGNLEHRVEKIEDKVSKLHEDVHKRFNEVHKGFSEVHKGFSEVHKEASRNLRLILFGFFSISATAVSVNQFFSNTVRKNDRNPPSLSAPTPLAPAGVPK